MYGPGTVLASRYRLDGRVGGGGMGDVWRSTDQLLERTVAVKMMRQELVEEPGFADRFLAEARTMAAIKHPGVVAIHDYRGDESGAFLVMEYIEGEALARRLHRFGRLDPARTMRLIAQAADALHAAHLKGVVHRDIKPGNLLVTADDTVVLTDFGIARSAASTPLTATGAVVGTPSYLAPEQVLGKPATARSDVYALGVVAYECLAGRRPFDGDNPFEVAMKRLREPPPPLGVETPPAVLAVVERTLAADPEQRWGSAAELAAAARVAVHPGAAAATFIGPAATATDAATAIASPASPAGPTALASPASPAVPASPAPRSGSGRDDLRFASARVPVRPADPPVPPSPPTMLEPRSPVPPPVSPPPVSPPPVSPPPVSPPPVSPSPAPRYAVPPAGRPRRPVTVVVASLLLLGGATGLALYFAGVLRVLSDVSAVYQRHATDAGAGDAADAIAALEPVGAVVAGTGLAIAVILMLLAWPVLAGRRTARVWALLLGFLVVCCCAPPVAFDNFGNGLGAAGLTLDERTAIESDLAQVVPDWYATLAGPAVLASLGALLLALFMLNLSPATRYFRRPPQPMYRHPQYPHYPYYYGYPPRR